MSGQQRSHHWLWVAIGYGVLLVVVVLAMVKARQAALSQLSTPQSVAEWKQWREDVQEQQSARGPVQRRVPTSDEPPALVLMRDYFGTSLFGAVLFSTALYWVLAWLVSGVMRSQKVSGVGCRVSDRIQTTDT
jgi:hypothetical protein